MKHKVLFLFILLTIIATLGFAQTTGTWALTSNANCVAAGSFTGSTMVKGSGSGTANYGSNGVYSTGWNTTSLANARTGNDYYEYTVTATTALNVSSVTFYRMRSGNAGTAQAFYSINGATEVQLGNSFSVGTSSTQSSYTGLSLSVPSGQTFRVRVYGWSFQSSGNFYNRAMVITGTLPAAVTLASANPAVSAANVDRGTVKQPIYRFTLADVNSAATLNTVNFTTAGTYVAADITNFKLWYNSADAIGTATQIGSTITTGLGTGSHSFTGLTQAIASGATGYFWISADVSGSAVAGNAINTAAIATGDLTFAAGTKSGTAYAGGSLTFVATSYLINEGFDGGTWPPTGWAQSGTVHYTGEYHSPAYSVELNNSADYLQNVTLLLAKPGTISWWGKYLTNGSQGISTSTDGTNWTPRVTQALTTTATKYTADLSAYSNVYIRFTRPTTSSDILLDDVIVTLRAPGTQTSAVSFSSVQPFQFTINWTNGDGDKRVVFVKEAAVGTPGNPLDGTNYTAGTNWTSKGTQLGSTGYYCVYNNTGTSVTVTNLNPNTAYYVVAYEYNTASGYAGAPTLYVYKTSAATGNTTTLPSTYTVDITSTPSGADIFVDSSDSNFNTPHTFTMTAGTSATYSVSLAGYTVLPANFPVNNIQANTSQEFTCTLIPVPDIPADTPTEVGGSPATGGVIIDSELDLYAGPAVTLADPIFLVLPYADYLVSPIILSYTGHGIGDLIITVGPGSWYGLIYYSGAWHFANIPDHWPLVVLPGHTATITFLNVDFGAKGDGTILLNDGGNPLPVELSSFNAVLTSQYYVSLTWTTESETSALGFNVRRSDTNNLAESHQINMELIQATNTSVQQSYTMTDTNDLEANHTYYYWLESVDMDGSSIAHGPVSATVLEQPTPQLPEISIMKSAYPNPLPLGASTNIEVNIKAGEKGTVTVYNILGQTVKTFNVNQGTNKLTWNAKGCASGIYFYKLSTPSLNATKKLVIVN